MYYKVIVLLFACPMLVHTAKSLYNGVSYIEELTRFNFDDVVNKGTAYYIEFYYHNCPSCQRYASSWKTLVREFVDDWKPHLRTAVLNCGNSKNTKKFCRRKGVRSTPRMKYFSPSKKSVFDGATYTGSKYKLSDQAANLAFMIANDPYRSKTTPTIKVLKDKDMPKEAVSSSAEIVAVIIERNGPKLANQLVLDFGKQKNVQILSASRDHKLVDEHDVHVPGMLVYEVGEWDKPIYVSERTLYRHTAKDVLNDAAK